MHACCRPRTRRRRFREGSAWLSYLVPQYANRIAWMSDDGGYFEGQSYSFKFTYILEALAALRSATGIDIFRKPAIRNAGDFWLYCMSLNYWWPHGGDNMPLVNPYGNLGDAYISAMLASSTGNRPVQWWSEAVPADPSHVPFRYLSATGVRPQPPVALAQAKAFRDTGQVSAFARPLRSRCDADLLRSTRGAGQPRARDQNSFVLHAGGEILAADVCYNTNFGDENYNHLARRRSAQRDPHRWPCQRTTSRAMARSRVLQRARLVFFGATASAHSDGADSFRLDVLYVGPGFS